MTKISSNRKWKLRRKNTSKLELMKLEIMVNRFKVKFRNLIRLCGKITLMIKKYGKKLKKMSKELGVR
jgi:hypothetical protein